MQSTHKVQLRDMAFGCIKSAMPVGKTYVDEDRGTLTVETFIDTGRSVCKVFVYARLETNLKDGAFIIIVDPSNDLNESAFQTTGHWKNSFDDMYRGKCLYAADYVFGLAFEHYPEYVTLHHEYPPQ